MDSPTVGSVKVLTSEAVLNKYKEIKVSPVYSALDFESKSLFGFLIYLPLRGSKRSYSWISLKSTSPPFSSELSVDDALGSMVIF